MHLGMGNSPPIWLDWTHISYLGLSVKKADDDIGILFGEAERAFGKLITVFVVVSTDR